MLNLLCGHTCKIIKIDNEAKGAACSALMAIEFVNNDIPLIITNADQVIETAVSLAQPTDHQQIMQSAADTGQISPTDALLAAIAGGGDPTLLSEPTAGGNLAIVPPSSATAPPVIGGRNGGAGVADSASSN